MTASTGLLSSAAAKLDIAAKWQRPSRSAWSRCRADYTPRGAFIIGQILYGPTFGLVAFALLRPTVTVPGLRQATA